MSIWPLPLAIGALSLLAITLCLQLSQAAGHVPDCNPLLAGCTTISGAGRHGTAYFLFKALMLPVAGLLAVYWPLAWSWLRGRVGRVSGGPGILLLGLLSAAMLALYASYLGSDGALYRIYRRIGASSFLAGSFFCQLLFVISLARAGIRGWAPRLMGGLVAAQFLLGLGSLPFTTLAEPPLKDAAENIIEWWFGLALILFFPACAWLWRHERVEWQRPAG